jgi:hypothetical protein
MCKALKKMFRRPGSPPYLADFTHYSQNNFQKATTSHYGQDLNLGCFLFEREQRLRLCGITDYQKFFVGCVKRTSNL